MIITRYTFKHCALCCRARNCSPLTTSPFCKESNDTWDSYVSEACLTKTADKRRKASCECRSFCYIKNFPLSTLWLIFCNVGEANTCDLCHLLLVSYRSCARFPEVEKIEVSLNSNANGSGDNSGGSGVATDGFTLACLADSASACLHILEVGNLNQIFFK